MKRSRHWVILSLVLVLGGLAIAGYKVRELGYPVWPDETSELWTVQAHLELDPGGGPVKAELLLPTRNINFALSNQTFVSRGWGLTEDNDEWQRTAEWSIRRARGDHDERRPDPELRLDLERAAVVEDDLAGDGEAEARAFAGRLGREEGREDLVADVVGDARARVADRDDHLVGGAAQADVDFAALGLHGVAGVPEQVEEDLTEGVLFHPRRRVRAHFV